MGFGWQHGYGAFSVGISELEGLKQYIRDQRNHHRKRAFKEEYLDLLRRNGVDFDEKFIWEQSVSSAAPSGACIACNHSGGCALRACPRLNSWAASRPIEGANA